MRSTNPSRRPVFFRAPGQFSAPALCLALALGCLAISGPALAQDSFPKLWEASVSGTTGRPVLAELFANGRFHPVVSNHEGRVQAYDGATGELLWQAKLGSSLTDPICGFFAPDGSLGIAVASRDDEKRLFILRASDGRRLWSTQLDSPASQAPTPFPLPRAGGAPGGPPMRHGVAMVDDAGRPYLFKVSDDAKEIESVYEPSQKMLDQLRHRVPVAPPASGEALGKGSADIVVAYKSGVLAFNRDDPALFEFFGKERFYDGMRGAAADELKKSRAASDLTEINTLPILANVIQNARVDGLDFDEVLFGLTISGRARYGALEYNELRAGKELDTPGFLNLWRDYDDRQEQAPPARDPLAMNLLGGVERPEVVLTGKSELSGFDGLGQTRLFKLTTKNVYSTGPVAIPGEKLESSLLAFVETPQGGELHLHYLPNIRGEPLTLKLDFRPAFQPVVGELDGADRNHEAVFTTNDGRLVCYQLAKMRTMPLSGLSWQCRGATVYRTGHVPASYMEEMDAQRAYLQAKVEEAMAAARDASAKGDNKALRQALNAALALDPRAPGLADMDSSLSLRENMVWIALGLLALLGLAAFGGYMGFRSGLKGMGQGKARKMLAAGRAEEALELCHRLRQSHPGDPKLRRLTVEAILAADDWSERSVVPLREELAANDSETDVLEGLVNCLVIARDASPENFNLFKRAEELSPQDAELKFVMGLMFKRDGDPRLARKYLGEAIELPDPPDDAFVELAELLLAENAANAKNLHVFEEARLIDPESPDLLRGLCLALMDAKRADGNALAAHEEMLEIDPGFAPSLAQLCEATIQAGDLDEALGLARRLREASPDDQEGVFLMAQCCLLAGREDDEALEALRVAAARFPSDKDIVSALARLYVTRGVGGDETVDTYRKALDLNPRDEEIARIAADAADQRGDAALAVAANERLADLGVAGPQEHARLARAYIKRGAEGEKVARALQEALKAEPGNEEFVLRLARVLKALDRADLEAIEAYRAAYALKPTLEIGKQLVKALDANDQLEEVAELAPRLLDQLPDDPDLQKRFARASMASDRADVAIEQYQNVLKRDPGDRDAIVHLAKAYAQKGRLDDESVALYRRSLEIDDKSDLVWMMVGRVALTREREEESVQAYRNAAAASEESPERVVRELRMIFGRGADSLPLRWLLAELLLHLNRLRESCEELSAILERDPAQIERVANACGSILGKDKDNQAALLLRGSLLKARGDFAAAGADLRRAFEINPSNADIQRELTHLYEAMLRESEDAEVRHRLGQVYLKMEEVDKAIGCFQRSAQDYRFETEAVRALGVCFARKGMLDFALQEFKKLPVDEEMKEILYDLARNYEDKGDAVGAKTAYKAVIAVDITFRDARQRYQDLESAGSVPKAAALAEQTRIHEDLGLEAQKRYELLDELGRGAMGIVYKARDNELDEIVALKILPEQISSHPEAVKRFRLEARAARRLAHPNIIRIHDIGEEQGRKFISMEFVDGMDLKQKFRSEGPPDYATLVRWTREIGSALDYAHNQGIVHRDIKPANIMLSGETCKVADYGIAKALDAADATMTGAVMGTPLYMSPEQVRGAQVDHRADIYSFGIMLYEFASGRPPFTEGDLAYQHLNVEPQAIGREIDERYKQMVMKCLAKEREERWETCGQMLRFLDTFAS